MSDKYETAFRRYIVEGGTVAEVARELDTSTASVIRWSRKWEKANPQQAHELRRAAAEGIAAKPVGFMARVAAQVEAEAHGLVSPPAAVEDEDEEADGVVEDLPEDADALTIVRHQIKDLRRYVEAARRAGQIETVQRFTRSLVELVNAQRQLEKAQRHDDGVIVASVAEVADAIKKIDEKVQAVAEEPLVCAECGRKMRREKAGG